VIVEKLTHVYRAFLSWSDLMEKLLKCSFIHELAGVPLSPNFYETHVVKL
jgi:hypothetical protein